MQRHEQNDGVAHEGSAWCTVEDKQNIYQARVVHIGRGKFKILQDNQQGIHLGKIVDASDIFGCDVEKS